MITALLVSVNYSDYLQIALPYNTKQFDEIIVLTIESDNACQDVCNKYSNVKCLVFPDRVLKKNGKQFNKGALLNKGLKYLDKRNYSGWLVLTDSDIVFPENFKELMISKEKDPNVLYGMRRNFCSNLKKFNAHMRTKNNKFFFIPKWDMPFIGFCQIFFYKVNKFSFAEDFNAEASDILFLTHFSEQLRKFIDFNWKSGTRFPREVQQKILKDPSFDDKLFKSHFVIHLGESIQNWQGRITKKFI